MPDKTEAFGDSDNAPIDKALLGAHAKRLLDDPVLSLAFERVERKLYETWAGSDPQDAQGRERVFAVHQGLTRVRGELRTMMSDLRMIQAEERLKEDRDRRQRERRERQM